MVLVPKLEPYGRVVQADCAASARMADDFQTALDADRLAVLLADILLGAAINGCAPWIARVVFDHQVRL